MCAHVCVFRVRDDERKARGQGVKEVRFNHREVKIDDKSSSVITPSLLHDVGTSFIASQFNFRDLFAGGSGID